MRGRVTKSLAVAAALGTSAACLFPSLDFGPSDAAADGGLDASADVVDSGAAEAEASAPDAGPFCASLSPKPIFCADFDEGSVTAGWDDTHLDQGTVTLSTTTSVSSPAAALAQTPATQTGYPVAALEKKFPQPTGDVVVAFDLDLETIDPNAPYTKLLALSFDGNNPPFVFYLQIPDPSHVDVALAVPQADGGESYDDFGVAGLPQLGKWTHVEIDLFKSTTDATMASGQVLFDGSAVIPKFDFGSSAALGNVTLAVGVVGANSPTNAWSVHVDDVTYDVK